MQGKKQKISMILNENKTRVLLNVFHLFIFRAQDIFRSGLESLRLKMTVERNMVSDAVNDTLWMPAPSGTCDL